MVNWGTVRRIEIEPAGCPDPSCEVDHGYTAQDLTDDLTVRMSEAADGANALGRLVRFASLLQQLSA